MSIIIKGMKMPKDGIYWCEIGVAGEIATITIHGEDRKAFPLIPIPEHGDLIDRDALTISTAVPLDGKPYQYVHIDNIKAALPIIQAEKG